MGSPQAVVAQRPEGRALRRARTGRADDKIKERKTALLTEKM